MRVANVKAFIPRKNFSSYDIDRAFRLEASSTIALSSEIAMAMFKLPLSGDVPLWINPITWFMSGNQININLGESSDPQIEAEILDSVGSYGRQLGQLFDVVITLLDHLPDQAALTPDDRRAIASFKKMADDIATIKQKHRRPARRPGWADRGTGDRLK